jgi:hypothetical protein
VLLHENKNAARVSMKMVFVIALIFGWLIARSFNDVQSYDFFVSKLFAMGFKALFWVGEVFLSICFLRMTIGSIPKY